MRLLCVHLLNTYTFKEKKSEKIGNVLAAKLPSIIVNLRFFIKLPFWYFCFFKMEIFSYCKREISVFKKENEQYRLRLLSKFKILRISERIASEKQMDIKHKCRSDLFKQFLLNFNLER